MNGLDDKTGMSLIDKQVSSKFNQSGRVSPDNLAKLYIVCVKNQNMKPMDTNRSVEMLLS